MSRQQKSDTSITKDKKKFFRKAGLYPKKTKPKVKPIFAFDVETYANNQKIFCTSIVGKDFKQFFFSRQEFEEIISSDRRFRGSMIWATNLGFDLTALYKNEIFVRLNPIERNGSIIYAFCYCLYDNRDKKIYSKLERQEMLKTGKYKSNQFYKITFADSTSHLLKSVSGLGKIVKLPKMESPKCLGYAPSDENEINHLLAYNLNDSEITFRFMNWLQEEYNKLGCELKVTISSTSLDLFVRRFLKITMYAQSDECIKLMFQGYYGGRVETYVRGVLKNIKSFDVNSLYPFIMKTGIYPFGVGILVKSFDLDSVKSFEGVGYFELDCPYMKIPFLPVKMNKLFFPYGLIKGYYSFVEIRYALSLGYKILKTGKAVVWNNKFNPFKEFVNALYSYRLERKVFGDGSDLVPKILMNGLYGKFAYKFFDKEMIIHSDYLGDYIDGASLIAPYPDGKHFRIIRGEGQKIPSYVHPQFSIYTTAQARIYMHKLFRQIGVDRILYSDTDCIFINGTLKSDSELGGLKLENEFLECCLIKPKMYGGRTKDYDNIKIKGLTGSIKSYDELLSFAKAGKINKTTRHFRKLRGALSKGLNANEIYYMNKELDFNDDKRKWEQKNFGIKKQLSEPLLFNDETYKKFKGKKFIDEDDGLRGW